MKAILCIGILIGIASISASAMNSDYSEEEDHYEDNPGYMVPMVKIWTLSEPEQLAHTEYVYNPNDTIHHVVNHGNLLQLYNRLLAANENEINGRDQYGNTPLHIASHNVDWQKVDLLLTHGASPEVLNSTHQDPIDMLPEVEVNFEKPLTSIMQSPFVIQAMIEAKLNNQDYKIIECALTESGDPKIELQ